MVDDPGGFRRPTMSARRFADGYENAAASAADPNAKIAYQPNIPI